MSHRKDTDYLSISTRIRAMENRMLSQDRVMRLIEAKDMEEASKVLSECGYGSLNSNTASALEELLSKSRGEIMADMASSVPEPSLVAVFQIKYDYHNVKVVLKALAQNLEPDSLLLGGGRYEPAFIADCGRKADYRSLSPILGKAATEAKELLEKSGDPQLADFLLDKAYFAELMELAVASQSQFIIGYVTVMIDVANLRSAVRAARLEKENDFLKLALVSGGNVSVNAIIASQDLAVLFQVGVLSKAAAEGSRVANTEGHSLTEFEKLCDNALLAYLSSARRIPFGEGPVIAYIAAKENEITAIRSIMSGRMAGLDGELIRSRLRLLD